MKLDTSQMPRIDLCWLTNLHIEFEDIEMKLKRYAMRAAFLSASLLSLVLMPPEAKAADTIKIGVVGVFSGNLSQYGLPSINAAELVVADINAKGGVLGKQIEIVTVDDQCKPELATNVATKLIEEKVDVVMGHTCSGTTKSTVPLYTRQKLVTMSPASTNVELTSGQYPYFFRTIAPDTKQAKVGVDFVLDTLGAKKVAILHDKGDYGKVYAEFAKKFVEESGKAKVVIFEGITPEQLDYSAVIQKVRSQNVDVLIYGGYHPEASKLVQGMRKKGMKIPFISEDAIKGDSFLKLAGPDAEGVYATGTKDNTTLPLYQHAVAEHKKKYGTAPGSFFFEAYAATQALLNAIEKSGGTDPDKLAQTLRTEYLDTPLGRISFDEHGDAIGTDFVVYQVKDGKFIEVK